MRILEGWRIVDQLGPATVGIAIFVVAMVLDGRFDSGAPIFRTLPATIVVWLSLLATAILASAWYLASRGRGRFGAPRRGGSIKQCRE
jgi:hypothetical protein